ncbi:DeoR family transcriptional regulator, partial [Escherichia coli]|uniref:DeoR family transcriptional regulator n=1 Tax=Escherichia coli TaxID=562 RepID=UPI00227F3D28
MPVNTAKRREHIIDLLCEHGSVRVEQLSKQFAVSTVTIRNDLRFLERKGCALRAYGGAMLNQQFAFDRPLRDKGRLNRDVKTLIANAAAGYVRDGDALTLEALRKRPGLGGGWTGVEGQRIGVGGMARWRAGGV